MNIIRNIWMYITSSFIDDLMGYFYKGDVLDESYKFASMYILTNIVAIVILLFYSPIYYFALDLKIVGVTFLIAPLVMLALVYISRRLNNYTILFGATISVATVPIGVATYYTGGYLSPIMFWQLCIILSIKIFARNIDLIIGIISSLALIGVTYWFAYNDIKYEREVFSHIEKLMFYGIQYITQAIVLLILMAINRKVLDNSMDDLRNKNEHINHFIRILCHDIANPLTIMIARSEMGARKYLSEEKQKKSFVTILRAGKLVSNILDEVRTYEALSDGKIKLELAPVSIKNVLDEAKFIVSKSIEDKSIDLKVMGLDKKDINIMAEESSLTNQVLSNIFSNAIKFSNQGESIEVSIREFRGWIEISVQDHGIGIPKNLLGSIFSTGERTSRLGTNGERGTGFGLPIVKTYVELYGGKISVLSSPRENGAKDSGTCIKLSFKKAA